MIFDSWWDKFLWKRKVKQISKKFARGKRLTGDEWNTLAKPFLRQAMANIERDCPYRKSLEDKNA